MSTSARLSYGLLVLTLVLAAALHLSGPLLIALFSYFALRQLLVVTGRKWLSPPTSKFETPENVE
jgi:hypothetical protein